ncbi:UNVERIFIED_CONTAM: hypothetical protein DV094_11975, partial [Bifidobacterium longum subsp. infantis]|nr:hypothetical protein [Bifidobacterium longum subsp. infantis]
SGRAHPVHGVPVGGEAAATFARRRARGGGQRGGAVRNADGRRWARQGGGAGRGGWGGRGGGRGASPQNRSQHVRMDKDGQALLEGEMLWLFGCLSGLSRVWCGVPARE